MDLIKIYNGSLVNARELHSFMESGQKFADWIKNRIEKYDFKEGKDFFLTLGKSHSGRPSKDYYLTLSMAKELAMVENNAKGKEARAYFINAEETLQSLKHSKRFQAFLKLETTKRRLQQNIESIGGTHDDFIQVDLAGRKILFNGNIIPDEELPTLTLKGRDFATELTNGEFIKEDITLDLAKKINEDYHQEVRTLIKRSTNIKPEDLPTEDKLERLGE